MIRTRGIQILILVLILIGCSKSNSNLNWVSKVSRINFPPESADIEIYDNGESFQTFYLVIPNKSLTSFILNNRFKKIPNQLTLTETPPMITLLGLSNLRHSMLPNEEDLLYVEGRSDSNSWVILISPETGELWGEVRYSDWAGDAP